MKKYIALLLFFAVFVIAANQDMQKGHKQKQDQQQVASTQGLTMSDVQAAFEQGGSPLEAWDSPKRFYTLNDIAPAFYKADSGEFAIYVFQSDADRAKGHVDFNNQTATAKVALSKIYEVRNVLIFELKQPAHYERMQKVIDSLYGSAKPEILSIDELMNHFNNKVLNLFIGVSLRLVQVRAKDRI